MRKMRALFGGIILSAAVAAHAGPGGSGAASGNGRVSLAAWRIPYAPLTPRMAAGLQALLHADAAKGLRDQSPALGVLAILDPASETHRRLMGAIALPADFETRVDAALEAGDGKAVAEALDAVVDAYRSQDAGRRMDEAIDARADEIVSAVTQGDYDMAELAVAAAELAPFAAVSAQARIVQEVVSRVRAHNTWNAVRKVADSFKGATARDGELAMQAIEMMARAGKDLGPSIDNLKRISNQRQLDALKLLIDNDYQVSDKLPSILLFENEHQVAALAAMAERGRDLRPSLDSISRFDNEHQAAAVELLAPTDYEISNKIRAIASFEGPKPVEALSLMVERHRTLEPSLPHLARFSNDHQVAGLRVLLEAPIRYQIADKAETLGRFSNPFQVQALEALASRARPVRWMLGALERVDSAERAKMVEDVAVHITKPHSKNRGGGPSAAVAIYWALIAAAMGHWLIGMVVFALGAAAFWYFMNLGAKAIEATLRANRGWLNARPEIERALGQLDDPDLLSPRD